MDFTSITSGSDSLDRWQLKWLVWRSKSYVLINEVRFWYKRFWVRFHQHQLRKFGQPPYFDGEPALPSPLHPPVLNLDDFPNN